MRRALVLTIATLAAALVAIALACGSNPIIATIVLDAGHIKCEVGDAGDVGEANDSGQFCSTTLTSCGSKNGFYEIIDSPDCGASGYECGCDGISYYNSCVRQQAKMSRAGTGPCAFGTGVRPKGCSMDGGCTPNHAGCAFIATNSFMPPAPPPDADIQDIQKLEMAAQMACQNFASTYAPGTCWALPDPCPSSSSRGVAGCNLRCMNDCKAIETGGLYFSPCLRDASGF